MQRLSLLRSGRPDPPCDTSVDTTFKLEERDDNARNILDRAHEWGKKTVEWESTTPIHIKDPARKYDQKLNDDVYFVMGHLQQANMRNTHSSVKVAEGAAINAHVCNALTSRSASDCADWHRRHKEEVITGTTSATIKPDATRPTALVGFSGGGRQLRASEIRIRDYRWSGEDP